MTGPHLDNGNLMLGLKTEERLRNAYVVVEITLRSHHVVLLREHCIHQFLCSGFPIGACNGNDGNIELPPMLTSQVLEGLQTVLNF